LRFVGKKGKRRVGSKQSRIFTTTIIVPTTIPDCGGKGERLISKFTFLSRNKLTMNREMITESLFAVKKVKSA